MKGGAEMNLGSLAFLTAEAVASGWEVESIIVPSSPTSVTEVITEAATLSNEAAVALMSTVAIMYLFLIATILLVCVVCFIAQYKIFKKAGKEGWEAIIPIYNCYVLFDIAMGNGVLFLLLFVPFVNFAAQLVVQHKLAQAFGKGFGYTLGLIFLNPIFMLMLAFGDAEYIGPQ